MTSRAARTSCAVAAVAAIAACAPLAAALGACRPAVCDPNRPAAAAHPLPRPAKNGAHAFTHAHNDYEHTHPLVDALAARFASVEADVWLRDGVVKVSHEGIDFKGTLQALYLDPLAARVEATGSVAGDGAPFTLWIDIKDGSIDLQDALAALLDRYPMLTRFSDDHVDARAVTVLLTGDGAAKRALVERPAPRPYARDDNDFHPDDPHADFRWTSYALDWGKYVAWDGRGAIPDDERRRLLCIVDGAHAKGRTVRLYATPETPAYWQLALDVGVDFINTDRLVALSRFLDTH